MTEINPIHFVSECLIGRTLTQAITGILGKRQP